jgi:hypothetical protein
VDAFLDGATWERRFDRALAAISAAGAPGREGAGA